MYKSVSIKRESTLRKLRRHVSLHSPIFLTSACSQFQSLFRYFAASIGQELKNASDALREHFHGLNTTLRHRQHHWLIWCITLHSMLSVIVAQQWWNGKNVLYAYSKPRKYELSLEVSKSSRGECIISRWEWLLVCTYIFIIHVFASSCVSHNAVCVNGTESDVWCYNISRLITPLTTARYNGLLQRPWHLWTPAHCSNASLTFPFVKLLLFGLFIIGDILCFIAAFSFSFIRTWTPFLPPNCNGTHR